MHLSEAWSAQLTLAAAIGAISAVVAGWCALGWHVWGKLREFQGLRRHQRRLIGCSAWWLACDEEFPRFLVVDLIRAMHFPVALVVALSAAGAAWLSTADTASVVISFGAWAYVAGFGAFLGQGAGEDHYVRTKFMRALRSHGPQATWWDWAEEADPPPRNGVVLDVGGGAPKYLVLESEVPERKGLAPWARELVGGACL